MRKLGRQAVRQKTVVGVRPGGDHDGNVIVTANDGDMVKLEDPNNVAEMNLGGIDSKSLAFVLANKDLFSYFAGNIDTLGGLGQQSETLGQDQLLSASASVRIQKMQKEVTNFTTKALYQIMWYLWYDPNPKQKDVTRTAPGFESVSISVPFNPEDREGDFIQYNVKLEPYSMQHQSPEAKLQGIRTIMNEMVPGLTPFMQQQGVTINVQKFMKVVGKLSNISEIDEFFEYATPDLDQPVGSSNEVKQAPNTTRTNIRKNVSTGGTQQGRSSQLQQALLGQNPQNSTGQLSKATA
jgi:hypothetical protein